MNMMNTMNTMSTMNPISTLFIIRGLPGSGKADLAKQIVTQMEARGSRAMLVTLDSFFLQSNGQSLVVNFDRRLLGAAHDETYGRSMRYLREGYSVAVVSTFSTIREIERYTRGVARCGLDKDTSIQVIKCPGYSMHNNTVPLRAIERLKASWQDFTGETVYNGKAQ